MFFLGNERKYFTHIPGLRQKKYRKKTNKYFLTKFSFSYHNNNIATQKYNKKVITKVFVVCLPKNTNTNIQ